MSLSPLQSLTYRAMVWGCVEQRNLSSPHDGPAACSGVSGTTGLTLVAGSGIWNSRLVWQKGIIAVACTSALSRWGMRWKIPEQDGCACMRGRIWRWCLIDWAGRTWRCKIAIGKPPADCDSAEYTGLFILWEGESLCFWNCALVNNLERYENSEFICSWIVWIFLLLCHTHPQQYFLY